MKSNRPIDVYHASKPNLSLIKPQPTIFSFLASGVKFLGNRLFGNIIGEQILSSQKKPPIDINLIEFSDNIVSAEQHTIVTHDNARLDTAEFRLKQQSNKSGIVIVYLPGAGNLYQQDVNEYINMAKKYQCTVVTFNYRGTGKSTGKPGSEDHLITDCIAQVQRLLDSNIPAESIVLYSPSLGGAIGANVAHYFDLKGATIHHINFKSFSSMTNVITGLIRTQSKTGHYEYPGMIALGWLMKPVVKSILWASGWELEAYNHFTALPDQYKMSFVVRSPKDRRQRHGQNLVDDPQITHYASIYAALKYSGKATNKVIKMSTKNISEDGHSYQCELIDREGQKIEKHLLSFFNNIKLLGKTKFTSDDRVLTNRF